MTQIVYAIDPIITHYEPYSMLQALWLFLYWNTFSYLLYPHILLRIPLECLLCSVAVLPNIMRLHDMRHQNMV